MPSHPSGRDARQNLPLLEAHCLTKTEFPKKATRPNIDDARDVIAIRQACFTVAQGPDIRNICYATQNRQSAVRDLRKLVEVRLAVRATNNSSFNRLREIRTEVGVASYTTADGSELNPDWLKGAKTVGYRGIRFDAGRASKRCDRCLRTGRPFSQSCSARSRRKHRVSLAFRGGFGLIEPL